MWLNYFDIFTNYGFFWGLAFFLVVILWFTLCIVCAVCFLSKFFYSFFCVNSLGGCLVSLAFFICKNVYYGEVRTLIVLGWLRKWVLTYFLYIDYIHRVCCWWFVQNTLWMLDTIHTHKQESCFVDTDRVQNLNVCLFRLYLKGLWSWLLILKKCFTAYIIFLFSTCFCSYCLFLRQQHVYELKMNPT